MLDYNSRVEGPEDSAVAGKAVLRDVMLAYAGSIHWLDRDHRPRLVVSRSGRVAWSNAAARRWLVPSLPVSIRGGALHLSGPIAARGTSELLQEIDASRRPLPVADEGGVIRLLLGAQACETPNEEHFYVAVSLVRELPTMAETGLAAHFGLTMAEACVLDAIVTLEQPVAIAERLDLSINTVRTHIRRAYLKMGIHTQAELVRLCLAFTDA